MKSATTAMSERTETELRRDLRETERDLRIVRDPALRHTLGRQRRNLRDELLRRGRDA